MNFIDSSKPVVGCICGACMQPSEADIITSSVFSPESLSVITEHAVCCPKCKNYLAIKYSDGGFYTNKYKRVERKKENE